VSGLDGKRVLVVGASSGIGREVGIQAAKGGARVAFAARRADLLAEAVAAAGDGAVAVPCNIREQAGCDAVVAAAVEALGGLDALVYAAAFVPLAHLADTDADTWRAVFETNVVGASLVCRAALPHLAAVAGGKGRAVFVSASAVGRPLPAMAAYDASKAALEEMVRGWRAEQPGVGFSCVAVGPTMGTDVYTDWDKALLGRMSESWTRSGHLIDNGPGALTVEDAAAAVLTAVTAAADLRYVLALPPPVPTVPPAASTGASDGRAG
jgi:NAD(P)-dependent dehydrogenase (short-subunit alcohol dehydrogenase family)